MCEFNQINCDNHLMYVFSREFATHLYGDKIQIDPFNQFASSPNLSTYKRHDKRRIQNVNDRSTILH